MPMLLADMAGPHPHQAPPSARIDPIRHVLLATDLSSASAAATEEAISIARRTGAQLTILSVVDPRLLRLPGGRFLRRVDQEQARIEAGVRELVARARSANVRTAFLVWHGDPSDAILEAAEAEDVDLVVMGSHGRGRLGRLVLGSTSSRVSAESRRRVLVVQS
jgi:nucleotide-binding universal stress UspA family protein